jgi:hypothetical protein
MALMNFNFEVKIKSAYEALSQAVNLFQIYLSDKTPASGTEYYRAKSLLREGKLFFEEALKEAKKLVGPLPPYSTAEYERWREETARDVKLILGDKVDYEEIKKMMLLDSCLPKYYEDQQKGKRKLENLKCRLAIARLDDLIHQGEDLLLQAQKKLQASLV